jgi:hypothetical protein
MRFPRVKADGQGFYHCVSRVVERRFIFHTSGHGSAEAERFIKLMRRLEAFSGIRVLTYGLMSNHLSDCKEISILTALFLGSCALLFNRQEAITRPILGHYNYFLYCYQNLVFAHESIMDIVAIQAIYIAFPAAS